MNNEQVASSEDLRPIVVFYPDGKCMNAEPGMNLLESARSAGVSIDSSCGGKGVCGKCMVLVRFGEVKTHPTAALLTGEEKEEGYVFACQSEIIGDVVIEVPVSSQLGELQILQTSLEPIIDDDSVAPLTQKIDVALDAPSLEDNAGDLERLIRGLQKHIGDAELRVGLDVVRKLPGLLRDNDWQVSVTIADLGGAPDVIDIQPRIESRHNYGLGIDIGTTTIVVHLIDLDTASALGVQSEYNEQMRYGDDVIARIIYANSQEGGLEKLTHAVVGTTNSLIADLADSNQISPEDITCVVCAGNTTMTHFLLGIDPTSIRRAPYVPVAQRVPIVSAAQVGLHTNPNAVVYCFPAAGGYVGGDITSGVLATGMGDTGRISMLIDVGTNGEIVLGNSEWLTCCSCSAGPAFEGCGIEYGMHATAGAIERLEYKPEHDEVVFSTIGGKMPPRGICGSGLIDAMATLLKSGAIDRSGKINLSWHSPRVRLVDDEPQFVFIWGTEVGREDDIFLTEGDIQNLMRSKSAVYAGATLLLESVGLSFSDVEQIRLAGGFGNYLDVENAVMIGLLPDLPLDRIRFVGNTSAAGTRMVLLSENGWQKAEQTAKQMTYVELMAEANRFTDQFVAGLFLPHTDTSLFPSVMRTLSSVGQRLASSHTTVLGES